MTYDSKGNEIERVMISDFGELMGKDVRTFNPDSSLREATITAKGSVQRVDKYLYEAGQLSQILVYDSKGILRQKISKIYDQVGRVTEETYSDADTTRAKTVFRYDEIGNLVETAFFLIDGQKAVAPIGPCFGAHRITYKYDSNRRVIASTAFEPEGDEKKAWTYSYDERGNYSLYTIKSRSSVTRITYTHEYDSRGNWTKRTTVSETDDNLLQQMLNATGKKTTPDELRAMKESSKSLVLQFARSLTILSGTDAGNPFNSSKLRRGRRSCPQNNRHQTRSLRTDSPEDDLDLFLGRKSAERRRASIADKDAIGKVQRVRGFYQRKSQLRRAGDRRYRIFERLFEISGMA